MTKCYFGRLRVERGESREERGELELAGLDEVDDSFDDGVFVLCVVFFFEVVFEEFGDELPEVSGAFSSVLFDEFVGCLVGFAVEQEHEHSSLRGGHVPEVLLVLTEEFSFVLFPPAFLRLSVVGE